MISFLDNLLPPELVEIIAWNLHNDYMNDICKIINHKIVFILANEKLSFLVCEQQNYYSILEVEEGWNDVS
mgnify:CR=1 FL=1|tara:strand:- start:1028 stop:1240 length:213 start_codon:yes stop_codon:yes gene_type:complete